MENCCEVEFHCDTNNNCIYATDKPNEKCKYYHDGVCKSSVAQVNLMTLELKKIMIQPSEEK